MSSFLVSKEDVANFVNVPTLCSQEGINFLYSCPPEVLERIIPPPLELAAPVITGYVVQFGNTNFGGPYMESAVSVPVKYKGDTAGYSFNLMLYGDGAESGTIVGANCCGIPKKTADFMDVNRIDDKVTARVVRHGVTLLDIEVKLGQYTTPIAEQMLGYPEIGVENEGGSFFHTFNARQTEQGNTVFSDVELVKLTTKAKTQFWEPGELVSINVASSPDDPFGELEVVKPLGACYYRNEYVAMVSTKVLEKLDTDATMPYLMSGRYDRSMMGHYSTYLTGVFQD